MLSHQKIKIRYSRQRAHTHTHTHTYSLWSPLTADLVYNTKGPKLGYFQIWIMTQHVHIVYIVYHFPLQTHAAGGSYCKIMHCKI